MPPRLAPLLALLCLLAACGPETPARSAASDRSDSAPEALAEAPPDPARLEALRAALAAPTITERRQAVLALEADPALARALVVPLARALGDESRWVASPASKALDRVGPAALEALPELTAGLSHADSMIRWRCAKILAGLGPEAAAALPLLDRNAADVSETPTGRHWARVAAERIRGEVGPSDGSR